MIGMARDGACTAALRGPTSTVALLAPVTSAATLKKGFE